jgi:co-chaperonin GroES (HSP10)
MQNIKSVNSVILSIGKPLQEYIETESGFKLILAGQEHRMEWNISVKGSVVSLPKDNVFKGELKDGDEVYFGYFVCSDRSFDSDADFFNAQVDENYLKIFYDGHGNKIQIIAVPSIIDKQWVCSYINKNGEFVHGRSGTEREMEKWLAQFTFGNVQTYRFENLIEVQGEQFWKANEEFIFAKCVDNKPIALGKYVIATPIKYQVPKSELAKYGIQIPDSFMEATLSDRAIVFSGGQDLGLEVGQTVGYDGQYVQKYNFDGVEYIILEKNRILGTWE